jgi:integrase
VVYLRRRDTPDYIEKGFKNASADEPVKEQPLFPDAFEALKSMFVVGGQGLIFKNPNGSFFTYRQIQAAYDRAFIGARLPYRGTHVLRHGGTRNVYNETGDLSIAQQILGNSDVETTLVYARRHKGALTKLAESHWEKHQGSEGCVANV